MNIIQNIDDFVTAINDNTKILVIIDFSASWCGPCKKVQPLIEILAEKYSNVGFYKIDVDNADISEITATCDVKVLPTFCYFMKGEYITKTTGANDTAVENMILQINGMKNDE